MFIFRGYTTNQKGGKSLILGGTKNGGTPSFTSLNDLAVCLLQSGVFSRQ